MTSSSQAALRPAGGRIDLLIACLVLAAGVFVCAPVARDLRFLWTDSQFYGHAYAIPAVASRSGLS